MLRSPSVVFGNAGHSQRAIWRYWAFPVRDFEILSIPSAGFGDAGHSQGGIWRCWAFPVWDLAMFRLAPALAGAEVSEVKRFPRSRSIAGGSRDRIPTLPPPPPSLSSSLGSPGSSGAPLCPHRAGGNGASAGTRPRPCRSGGGPVNECINELLLPNGGQAARRGWGGRGRFPRPGDSYFDRGAAGRVLPALPGRAPGPPPPSPPGPAASWGLGRCSESFGSFSGSLTHPRVPLWGLRGPGVPVGTSPGRQQGPEGQERHRAQGDREGHSSG